MSVVTFDTLKFANRLKAANVPPAQAEAEAEAFQELLESHAQAFKFIEDKLRTLEDATKHGLADTEVQAEKALARLESKVDVGFAKTDGRFAEIRGEMLLVKWMLGLLMAGVASLVLKSFF